MSNQTTQSIKESKAILPLWKDGKNGSSLQFLRSFNRLEKEEPNTHRLIKNHIEEGFECEDSEYKYKVGKSQYGFWLSRKKKPTYIPDPPTTEVSSKMTAVEDNDTNNDSNNNDYSRDVPGPLRPTAFTNNDNDNNNNNQTQKQQQLQEQQTPQQSQQQQPAVVYPYSVKIEQSSNGSAKVSIHTYNDDPDKARYEAIRLFIQTREELRSKGVKVLEA